MTTYRPATLADVDYIVKHLRKEDLDECRAAHTGSDTREVLLHSVRKSYDCRVAEVDGVPFAIYGIGPAHTEGWSSPWLVGTDVLTGHRRFLTRVFPEALAEWSSKHPRQCNFVLSSNTKTILWLKWIGFTIADPFRFGPAGHIFHPFFQVYNHVCARSRRAGARSR